MPGRSSLCPDVARWRQMAAYNIQDLVFGRQVQRWLHTTYKTWCSAAECKDSCIQHTRLGILPPSAKMAAYNIQYLVFCRRVQRWLHTTYKTWYYAAECKDGCIQHTRLSILPPSAKMAAYNIQDLVFCRRVQTSEDRIKLLRIFYFQKTFDL